MHTFTGNKVYIIHHGDYLGEIRIVDKKTDRIFEVDSEDIFNFVAEYIKYKRIGEIENMSYKDLF